MVVARDARRGKRGGLSRTARCCTFLAAFLVFVRCAHAATAPSAHLADTVKVGGTVEETSTITSGKKRKRRKVKRSSDSILSDATAAASPSSRVILNASNASLPGEGITSHKKKRRRRKGTRPPESSGASAAKVQRTNIENVSNDTKTKIDANLLTASSRNSSSPAPAKPASEATIVNSTRTRNSTSKSRKSTASEAGSRESATLRRLKREWRDAVKLGIAYDWMRFETVSRSKKSDSSSIKESDYQYVRIGPWGKNLLRWHFSVQGPANSVYKNGVYHGRVLLPKDYPGSPPRVQLMTPSGRFIPGHDICLSASAYHPETWTPRWTVHSLVDALRLHMLTNANEIGGKEATNEEREKLALESRKWNRGSINHEYMVNAGIFPIPAADADQCEERDEVVQENGAIETKDLRYDYSESEKTVFASDEAAPVGQQAARRTRNESLEKHPRHGSLVTVIVHAVAEVLRSKTKLVIFAFLTVFVILNRH